MGVCAVHTDTLENLISACYFLFVLFTYSRIIMAGLGRASFRFFGDFYQTQKQQMCQNSENCFLKKIELYILLLLLYTIHRTIYCCFNYNSRETKILRIINYIINSLLLKTKLQVYSSDRNDGLSLDTITTTHACLPDVENFFQFVKNKKYVRGNP